MPISEKLLYVTAFTFTFGGFGALAVASSCGVFDPDPCGCVIRSADCPDDPTPSECAKEAEAESADAGASSVSGFTLSE